jgi:hypothetical protein
MYKSTRRKPERFKLKNMFKYNNNRREQRIKVKKAINIVKTEL